MIELEDLQAKKELYRKTLNEIKREMAVLQNEKKVITKLLTRTGEEISRLEAKRT